MKSNIFSFFEKLKKRVLKYLEKYIKPIKIYRTYIATRSVAREHINEHLYLENIYLKQRVQYLESEVIKLRQELAKAKEEAKESLKKKLKEIYETYKKIVEGPGVIIKFDIKTKDGEEFYPYIATWDGSPIPVILKKGNKTEIHYVERLYGIKVFSRFVEGRWITFVTPIVITDKGAVVFLDGLTCPLEEFLSLIDIEVVGDQLQKGFIRLAITSKLEKLTTFMFRRVKHTELEQNLLKEYQDLIAVDLKRIVEWAKSGKVEKILEYVKELYYAYLKEKQEKQKYMDLYSKALKEAEAYKESLRLIKAQRDAYAELKEIVAKGYITMLSDQVFTTLSELESSFKSKAYDLARAQAEQLVEILAPERVYRAATPVEKQAVEEYKQTIKDTISLIKDIKESIKPQEETKILAHMLSQETNQQEQSSGGSEEQKKEKVSKEEFYDQLGI